MTSSRKRSNSVRLEAVDRVRQGWVNRLVDLSRRNNLLYYRDLKTGTLDFSNSDQKAIAALLGGELLPLARLVSQKEQDRAIAAVQQIHRRALTNLEEKGLETLFLAVGMATWTPATAGSSPQAPILLVPLQIATRGTVKLQRAGEAQVNLVLLHLLDVEYGCTVMPQDLLAGAESIAEDNSPDLAAVFERLESATQTVPGFKILPRTVLGNFSFQKMAMVRDLRDRLPEMAAHDIIAAIAGDTQACQAAKGDEKELDGRELDQIPPEQEFLVFDADSSQQKVIYEVLSNRNCVIQGPPGTGKSQTIANLITSLAAIGLKTLFVAEKRAALEVVMQRLQQKGLGHLLLDFHSADISRRAVMEQFAESLQSVRTAALVDAADTHRRFVDRRTRLNGHITRIHEQRSPAEQSVYALQGELLQFAQAEQSTIRLRGRNLERLTPAKVDRVEALLQELGSERLANLFLGHQTSLWLEVEFPSITAAQQALDRVQHIADELHPDFNAALTRFTKATGFKTPTTLDQAKEQISLVVAIADTLSRYSDNLFRENLDHLVQVLSPLRQGFVSEGIAWLFNGYFKNAIHTLRKLRRKPAISDGQILEEVTQAARQLRQWRSHADSTSRPCTAQNLDEVRGHLNALLTELPRIEALLSKQKLSQMPLDEFSTLFETLATEGEMLQRIARLREVEAQLDELGVKPFVKELKQTQPSPELWSRQFRYVWLASCLDQAYSETPELISFDGKSHQKVVQEFCDLDQERLKLAVQRVKRAHAERAIAMMNQHPDQEQLVKREAEKRARHLPLRRLLANAPDVVTTLRPCWMASPLSVSQLLDADRRYFDVVIFDEASQVLPEDAIPAILRAQRVVVAGDKHQLPPTTFFASEADDIGEESETPAEGFESLLDLMSAFLETRMLEWHYRSRHEELIAFSNQHIYSDRLVTFPSPSRSNCISHVLVSAVPGIDGQEESAAKEVQAVVDLVLKQAIDQPKQTLGVITMGLKHANRVQAALDEALKSRPDLEAFFDDSQPERFFVKNIERVQGDERDAIILSIGYGKDRSGKLPYRFGPLLYEGGERRLNVAITRARQRLTLVSSFNHLDMDPDRSNSEGVKLLRSYLHYAASEGKVLGDTEHSDRPLNPIEADVYKALCNRGIPLSPRWGASQYSIDMVAQHPEKVGQFVLAIECDGVTYRDLPTVRDRDRLRQQQLEALGWKYHRIWSTDWFSQRDTEIEKAIDAYQSAAKYAEPMNTQVGQSAPQELVKPFAPPQPTQPLTEAQVQRQPRPDVPQRDRINQYSIDELVKLIQWILSDGCLRTDDEIIRNMLPELGFSKRGVRIEARILQAIQQVRRLG